MHQETKKTQNMSLLTLTEKPKATNKPWFSRLLWCHSIKKTLKNGTTLQLSCICYQQT